jgi:hypothetical protein
MAEGDRSPDAGVARRSDDRRPTLIPRSAGWGPLDRMRVKALAPGQDLEPRRRVMCDIPLDVQRRLEQRWAARFSRSNPPTTPKKHELEREDLNRPSEVIPEAAKPTVLISD